MGYEVSAVEVAPTTFAAVRQQVAWSELGAVIPKLLDKVYAFLREASVEIAGHNVCVYHAPDRAGVLLEAGVQVAFPFEPRGEILCSTTPGGRAAMTVHVGEYSRLGEAHDAIDAWCYDRKLVRSGLGWEVYGDWSDDPRERRTEVFRLLP